MKRILAIIITLAIFATLYVPCTAVEDTAEAQWLPVSFASSISTDTQKKMMIKWNWNDLLADATTSGENSDLAIAGLVMSNQADFSKEDVEEVLNTLGFSDISSEYYSINTKETGYISNPARTFAHREINVNGEKKHIICAVIRGTRSVVDTMTDIKSVRDGFLDAGKNCLESLKEYQSSLNGATKENTILFVTGHSLGASAACVLSCLADEVAYKSAIHTYAIATPNYDTMGLESKDCQNIHMYTNLEDIVPKIPINFKKVGVSPNQGSLELRQTIQKYLARSKGIIADAEQIVIGSGSEYLYNLIVLLLGRDKTYAVEYPSYKKIKQVYSASEVNIRELPLGNEGIDSTALRNCDADVLHISPYRSYPTGVTASASKCLEYLRWAGQGDRYIVEDDFESEFSVSQKAEETLFSNTTLDNVIYMNTFSKTISPSFRVGYMILPKRLAEKFKEQLGFYSCTVPTYIQFVLAELISNGDFERHINRVRREKRRALSESQ